MFCDHDWVPRTGMDSGSICGKCGKASNREVDPYSSGVLGNTQLMPKEQSRFLNLLNKVAPHLSKSPETPIYPTYKSDHELGIRPKPFNKSSMWK